MAGDLAEVREGGGRGRWDTGTQGPRDTGTPGHRDTGGGEKGGPCVSGSRGLGVPGDREKICEREFFFLARREERWEDGGAK